MSNILYYLNQGNTNCPQIPTRYTNYLDKNNCLSEFITSTDKEIARYNLGIPDIVSEINAKIDAKVIERGNVAWDITPTEGNTEKVLSSHALYNTFLKYALRTELDNNIQQVWSDTVNKITETYNKIEEELNELNTDLRDYTDELRCEFDSFTTNIKLEFTTFTEHIVSEFTKLENDTNTKIADLESYVNLKVSDMLTFVNNKVETLETSVDNKIQSLTNLVNTKLTELTNLVNLKISDFTTSFNEQSAQLRKEMDEVKENVNDTLDKFQDDKYTPLEQRMRSIEIQVESFLRSEGGTALTNEFGDEEYLGVNQKTLTESLNKIWEKLGEMSGEDYKGFSLIVTPGYFIGEDGCNVNITATSEKTTSKFEHIELYLNGEKLYELDNVEYLEYTTHIDETSVLIVKAKILGVEYTQTKTIAHYSSFWLGAGNTYSDVMDLSHIIPITNGMRGAYNVKVANGQHIIVIVGDTLAEGFIRADINGAEIPFTESTVTVDNNTYKVFISDNTYIAGTYNIDING